MISSSIDIPTKCSDFSSLYIGRVGSDSEPPDERGDLSAAVSAGPDFRPQGKHDVLN